MGAVVLRFPAGRLAQFVTSQGASSVSTYRDRRHDRRSAARAGLRVHDRARAPSHHRREDPRDQVLRDAISSRRRSNTSPAASSKSGARAFGARGPRRHPGARGHLRVGPNRAQRSARRVRAGEPAGSLARDEEAAGARADDRARALAQHQVAAWTILAIAAPPPASSMQGPHSFGPLLRTSAPVVASLPRPLRFKGFLQRAANPDAHAAGNAASALPSFTRKRSRG